MYYFEVLRQLAWKVVGTFQKYFTDGDMLKDETLLEVATDVGFDKEDFLRDLTDQAKLESALNKALAWSEKGISGRYILFVSPAKHSDT